MRPAVPRNAADAPRASADGRDSCPYHVLETGRAGDDGPELGADDGRQEGQGIERRSGRRPGIGPVRRENVPGRLLARRRNADPDIAFRRGEEVEDGGLDVGDLRPVAVGVGTLLPEAFPDLLDRRVPLFARDGDVRFPGPTTDEPRFGSPRPSGKGVSGAGDGGIRCRGRGPPVRAGSDGAADQVGGDAGGARALR